MAGRADMASKSAPPIAYGTALANLFPDWSERAELQEGKAKSRQFPIATDRADHSIAMPPFTCRVAPVTYPASGLARYSTAAAISSGWPMRAAGIRALMAPF